MKVDQLEFVEASGELSLPDTDAAAGPSGTASRQRRSWPTSFAGFRLTTLALVCVIAGLLAWNAWMTREVLALKRHRIVSVSLASIITDFVHDQSRQQGSPEEAAFRTKLYLATTQKALLALARNGTPVLASEAVLGHSVPDETAEVKAAVAKAMAAPAAPAGQH